MVRRACGESSREPIDNNENLVAERSGARKRGRVGCLSSFSSRGGGSREEERLFMRRRRRLWARVTCVCVRLTLRTWGMFVGWLVSEKRCRKTAALAGRRKSRRSSLKRYNIESRGGNGAAEAA
jgi:hypothetical protein